MNSLGVERAVSQCAAVCAWCMGGEGMGASIAPCHRMLGRNEALPRVVVTDRGPGFFNPQGYYIQGYKEALRSNGFRAYVGNVNATKQPGDLAECWPHERVAAWAKHWLSKHPIPCRGGLDHMEDLIPLRLAACAKHINDNYNVDSVCRAWPRTMARLKKAKGDRLKG